MVVFRVSFLVLASVAAFAVARINFDRSRKPKSSIKSPENDSGFLQEEIEEEKEEIHKFEHSNVEPKEKKEVKISRSKTKRDYLKPNEHEKGDSTKFGFPILDKKWENVSEIERLKNVAREMELRRVTLEVKLLELNGLKEHQFDIGELHKHLKAKMAEIDMLNDTVIALQAEREKLHEEIKQNKLAEKQVRIAKKRILEMQGKMRVDAAQMKGQLMMLKEQVNGFHIVETSNIIDAKVEKKIKSMKIVELEFVEKKRRNKELQLEKRELSIMLDAAQSKITALSNMTERNIIVKMEEEMGNLKLSNENLRKQTERLQKNRFEMVEELVYQRWLNTCLRLEAQDYKTPRQRISKGHLSKNSSSDSHEKTRKLTLDDSFDSISSNTSSESDKITSTTIDSSSTNQTKVHNKSSLIHYIKRWGRSRYDTSAVSSPAMSSTPSRRGLIRRFSMSMVPSKTSMLRRTKGDNAMQDSETPSQQRVRRVSFNDSIQTVAPTFQDFPESESGASGDERKSGKRSEDSRTVNTRDEPSAALEEEEDELSRVEFNVLKNHGSSNSSMQEMDGEELETQVVSKINRIDCTEDLPSGVPLSEKEVGNQRVHLLAAFIFLFFILVVCFILLTGGIH